MVGDCDQATGICNTCDEGFSGMSCKSKNAAGTSIHPVINCMTEDDDKMTLYLGYINRSGSSYCI